jgi:hypothetical protein
VDAPPNMTAHIQPRYIKIPKFLPASTKSSDVLALLELIIPTESKTTKYNKRILVSRRFMSCTSRDYFLHIS